jgi:hypothetical protein
MIRNFGKLGMVLGIAVLLVWASYAPAYPNESIAIRFTTSTAPPRYVPVIYNQWSSTTTPLPTPAPTHPPAGDLGWRTIQGTVQATQGAMVIPLAGASVTCSHASYTVYLHCSGTTATAADGHYSFGSIFLHDTDRVSVRVEATGYQTQTVTRSGLETFSNPVFNFVLFP